MLPKTLFLTLIAALALPAATVTFADDFESPNPGANWTTATTFNDNLTGTHTSNYLLTTGNPNQWAQTTHDLPTAGSQYVSAYLLNGTYNPSTQGAILFANFTLDTIRQIATGSLQIRTVIFQNGIYYGGNNLSASTAWSTQSTGNVGAGTFTRPFFPLESPDFSETGTPLQVGYLISSNNYFGTTNTPIAGIDNFNATFTTVVPEPGTLSLLGGALLVAAGLRRRRSAR